MTRASLLADPRLYDRARAACRALAAAGYSAPARVDHLPPWLLAELVLSAARRGLA